MSGTVLPVAVELASAPSPPDACTLLLDLPYCLLLDSAEARPGTGRYSFLAADPFLVVRSRGRRVELRRGAGGRFVADDPFRVVARLLARYASDVAPGLPPFQGGVAGYWSYELAHRLERLPMPVYDDPPLPELCVGLYDRVLAWDHEADRCWLISTGLPAAPGPARERRAERRAAALLRRIGSDPARRAAGGARAPLGHPDRTQWPPTHEVPALPGWRSTFSREGYLAAVEAAREYILAGDIFQANLSQRLEAPLQGDAWALYLRLRGRNPAPFAAYFDVGDAHVLSSSPERFLRLRGEQVETRPIKGTAPRDPDPCVDRARAEALGRSPKDRAENVMIVDLLRNDLSVVCRDGTVEVPELCRLESYARVHHLASAVTGRLRAGVGAVDLLRAAFPGGSITGAPKVRAMQIIAELEPTRRSVYTGAIGYLGFDGSMDTSIAIRTPIVHGGRVLVQVGGGIVADSDPEQEYLETLHKARGIVEALPAAGSGDAPAHDGRLASIGAPWSC